MRLLRLRCWDWRFPYHWRLIHCCDPCCACSGGNVSPSCGVEIPFSVRHSGHNRQQNNSKPSHSYFLPLFLDVTHRRAETVCTVERAASFCSALGILGARILTSLGFHREEPENSEKKSSGSRDQTVTKPEVRGPGRR